VKFHPAAQILVWSMLVATLQALEWSALLIAAGLVLLATLAVSGHKFFHLLRRTRWIMLSLLLIYAWSTPGQAAWPSLGAFSPTREGLLDGSLQLLRLLAALGALAVLLDRLHRQQLIAGLYTLFALLRLIGLSPERAAVRLALTLHYAEVAMMRGRQTWQETLRGLFEAHGDIERHMELPLCRFTFRDACLLGGALAMLWLTLV
jgi:energy-coupling factor transport system permease protein